MFGRRKKTHPRKDKDTVKLGDIIASVEWKEVKNINLRVYPSRGEVKISAPKGVSLATVREFAESKQGWIRKHMDRYRARPVPHQLSYVTGETHWVRGQKRTLRLVEANCKPNVRHLEEEALLVLTVRPASSRKKRKEVLEQWYRREIKGDIQKLVAKWEPVMNVQVREFGVKKMKTRWGSCNTRAGRIWLNLELIKKSSDCLESVVVHEMVHLLERLHNKRFYRLMDHYLPQWRQVEKELQGRVD